MTFTGKTKNLGVIGYPIAHSFSPAMHNAAMSEARLDYAYISMPADQEELETSVKGIKDINFRVINLTIK